MIADRAVYMISTGTRGLYRRRTRASRQATLFGAALIVVSSLVSVGATAAADQPSKNFAKRVDIGGGRSMYVECRGSGSPTVLLLSGTDTASDLWHAADQKPPKVYTTIGKFTRVCAYDRPGAPHLDATPSLSDPVPQPTSPQDGVDDLVALLKAADVPGPYVLAAHSFAGTIARVFAAQHPDEVKGIVFVDVLTPELRAPDDPRGVGDLEAAQCPAGGSHRGVPGPRTPGLRRDPGPDRGSSTAEAHAGRRAHRQRQVRRCRPEAHQER